MRVLALDPGAERCGWAVMEGGRGQTPRYIGSGIVAVPRGDKEQYQPYRLRLINEMVVGIDQIMGTYTVGLMANETVPPVAGAAFSSNGVQAQLAATAVSVAQTMAAYNGLPVQQISALTVKKQIGGGKTATKVKVRNGVYHFFPEIKDEKWKEWVKVHDESDACAVGLSVLGYSV